MTPSNPDNSQPLIYRIADSLGVFHLVAPVNHEHTQSEVTGLESALATKAAKASNATNNHLAALDANGDLKDSGRGVTENVSASSTDLITSGGVYTALTAKAERNMINAQTPDGAYAIVETKATTEGQVIFAIKNEGGSFNTATLDNANLANLNRALEAPDSTPTANSDNLVTSGGVKAVLDQKMNIITIDNTPTASSNNLVTSGGVKAALDGKANTVHTHAASQVEGVMPYYTSYDGTALDLDNILPDPHTMQRLIIENNTGSTIEVNSDMFTSPTDLLPIHINNTPEQFVVDNGDYVLVTIFKVDRGQTQHGHDVCYFVYVEGIFNYEV